MNTKQTFPDSPQLRWVGEAEFMRCKGYARPCGKDNNGDKYCQQCHDSARLDEDEKDDRLYWQRYEAEMTRKGNQYPSDEELQRMADEAMRKTEHIMPNVEVMKKEAA